MATPALQTPPKLGTILEKVFVLINDNIFAAASIALVVVIVIAGYHRLMAADSPQAVKTSNATLMWGVIGYFLVLLAFFIVKLIAQTLGADFDPSFTL